MPQNDHARSNFLDPASRSRIEPVKRKTERLIALIIEDQLHSPLLPTVRIAWLKLRHEFDLRGMYPPFSERTFYRRVAIERSRRRREFRFARDRPGPSDPELA